MVSEPERSDVSAGADRKPVTQLEPQDDRDAAHTKQPKRLSFSPRQVLPHQRTVENGGSTPVPPGGGVQNFP